MTQLKQNPNNTGNKEGREEKVGYKHPPKHTQFKKGHKPVSHRQKGSLSLITYLKQGLQEITKDQTGAKKERAQVFVKNILYMAINERDKEMIKLIFNYIEGMPKQGLDIKHELKDILTQEQVNELFHRRTKKDNAGGKV